MVSAAEENIGKRTLARVPPAVVTNVVPKNVDPLLISHDEPLNVLADPRSSKMAPPARCTGTIHANKAKLRKAVFTDILLRAPESCEALN
jgi:hypothetical protein